MYKGTWGALAITSHMQINFMGSILGAERVAGNKPHSVHM